MRDTAQRELFTPDWPFPRAPHLSTRPPGAILAGFSFRSSEVRHRPPETLSARRAYRSLYGRQQIDTGSSESIFVKNLLIVSIAIFAAAPALAQDYAPRRPETTGSITQVQPNTTGSHLDVVTSYGATGADTVNSVAMQTSPHVQFRTVAQAGVAEAATKRRSLRLKVARTFSPLNTTKIVAVSSVICVTLC